MHALRHAYASVPLDAGESIKALSEYLGHSDPGFTLRTYTHLLPSSGPPDPQGDRRCLHRRGAVRNRRASRHITTPSETNVPSMCPGRLTAPPRHAQGRGPKTPPEPHGTPAQGHTRQYA
ncbi:hypothetical protein GCM10010238_49870 [Streptomyces griseoviridis]|uniref:Tyr recombinase domain-containing protein n=1 Tax=Streptomyces griseoviridis TaxID=45398 RepID=A0A918GR77_STRGD|nr:hypothetical protein GCM10010238_49870 [Streptomyces niveoruber]